MRTEDRGQRTEDRGQRTEDRGQRTEDRGQRTEDRLKISPSTLSTISALKLDNGWHSRSGPENQVADLMPEFGY
jgi:hypothetical protein